MIKELEALKQLKDLTEFLTRIDFVSAELREEVKQLLIKAYQDSNGLFTIIEKALNRLAMFEELFVKMDLKLEIETGDDSWGTSQDYGTYVRGDNSTFEELYITDDETVMLISKLKENEIETIYEDMTSELTEMEWKDNE